MSKGRFVELQTFLIGINLGVLSQNPNWLSFVALIICIGGYIICTPVRN